MKTNLAGFTVKLINWSSIKRKTMSRSASKELAISIYDAQNIDQLHWPSDSFSLLTKEFFVPLVKNRADYYVDNLKTNLKLLKVEDQVLPLMINNEEYDNSYLCSPYNFYISYALESLTIIKNHSFRQMVQGMLNFLAKILRKRKLNKTIHVNNFPFSTNLYPLLDQKTLAAVINYLTTQFPDHAIIFRTLNEYSHAKECQSLKNIGASLIAYRQIYLLDAKDPHVFSGKTVKKDFKRLQKTDYEILNGQQIKEWDFSKIAKMYQDLYIDRHSTLNPQYNEQFIHLLVTSKILDFKALYKNGSLEGIFGYCNYRGVLVSPFVGYNRNVPQEDGLYQLLSTILMIEAKEKELILNMGAGSSNFKKNRKAKGYLEYMAVYNKHLPFSRRLPWIALQAIINSIGVYYMRKY